MNHSIAVCGSSKKYPYAVVQTAVRYALNHVAPPSALLLGLNSGTDRQLRRVPFRRFEWDSSPLLPVKTYRLKKAAALVALWDGEDERTQQQVRLAMQKGIPVIVVLIESSGERDYTLHVELHPEELI